MTDLLLAKSVRAVESLQRRMTSPNESPGYTKQSNGEASVMLELLRIRSTPLLTSLPVPLWPGVVAPDKVLSMDQIKVFDI